MLCTPFIESKHAQMYAKCDHLLDFDDTLRVISLLLEIFRRLNATSIAFYTPNATHAAFSVETCTTACKIRPFTRFWRHTESYFALLEIFRRLYAISIALYMPKTMHTSSIVEWNRSVRKMRQFTRFGRKLSAISLVFDILRCLNAISIAFYTPNAMHAVYRVETCPNVRKMRPFTRFWRHTESYFAFVGDISKFKIYFHRILHAENCARQFHRR